MGLDLGALANFLVEAKINAWAGDKGEAPPRIPGYKRHVYRNGLWVYEDNYTCYYSAPGFENVWCTEVPVELLDTREQALPVWFMSYTGGIKPELRNLDIARESFDLLKEALRLVTPDNPYRGPARYRKGENEYVCDVSGDITNFSGFEHTRIRGAVTFIQRFSGGVPVPK